MCTQRSFKRSAEWIGTLHATDVQRLGLRSKLITKSYKLNWKVKSSYHGSPELPNLHSICIRTVSSYYLSAAMLNWIELIIGQFWKSDTQFYPRPSRKELNALNTLIRKKRPESGFYGWYWINLDLSFKITILCMTCILKNG